MGKAAAVGETLTRGRRPPPFGMSSLAETFERDGFVVVEGAISAETSAECREQGSKGKLKGNVILSPWPTSGRPILRATASMRRGL